jgi:hypothetical protein
MLAVHKGDKASGCLSVQLEKCLDFRWLIQGWLGAGTLRSKSTQAGLGSVGANGLVFFQLDQLRVGNDTVPSSIVLYIYSSFIKLGMVASETLGFKLQAQ